VCVCVCDFAMDIQLQRVQRVPLSCMIEGYIQVTSGLHQGKDAEEGAMAQ
jgi:hypothetical protein